MRSHEIFHCSQIKHHHLKLNWHRELAQYTLTISVHARKLSFVNCSLRPDARRPGLLYTCNECLSEIFIVAECSFYNVSLIINALLATEKRPYQFCVHTESTQNRRNDWVFAAHGQKAMQEWISAFQVG